ncbi:MAG: adenine deaminase [Sphaerochaeta sp.]|uniref:adenine deaminase n=1 Tax=Sphaerochaeta sp. TaxID=1972642 RepID=UPI003D0A8100
MVTKKKMQEVIETAARRKKADLCITNAQILDVYNKEWFEADLLVQSGYIAGFAECGKGEAETVVDGGGRYLLPGFIDSHVHIESSHATPEEFSNLVVPCGTTTVIADPHEICNVCGLDGLSYMLEASKETALQAFFMVPSCVPATTFEHSGAVLEAKDIKEALQQERVLGLGEMMDFPGVIAGTDLVLDKIMEAKHLCKVIDGHSPAIGGAELDAYASTGILTDHECENEQELHDRIRRGMYVMLREGSACKNVLMLLGGVTGKNSRRCVFCTDDRQPKSILTDGHINNNVRIAVQDGLDPIEAICMATVNSTDCYHLTDRGAIAPGKRADFLLCNDLKEFFMHQVYVAGELVAEDGVIRKVAKVKHDDRVSGMMHVKDFSIDRLRLPLSRSHVRVIDIIPGGVVTGAGEADVMVENGEWVHDKSQDIIKLAVVERHTGTGNVAVALLRGYGLQGGAMATSVAHDSHNIIVAGDDDEDMAMAVEHLISIGGGMVIVKRKNILASFVQNVAGLMSYEAGSVIAEQLDNLHHIAQESLHISKEIDPFMTLCFMSLPVIPAYKLTDMGLFDVRSFSFVPLELNR